MDQIKIFAEVVADVVGSYACPSPNSTMYYMHDPALGIDAVLVVPLKRANGPYIVVMTRLAGDQVIIETDRTDRPLEEALVAAGIRRNKVIAAWRGEAIATASTGS